MSGSQSFEDAFASRVLGMIDPMSEAVAQSMGLGGDTQTYSEADQLKMWNASPIADPDQRAQQMLTMYQQGMHPEDITDQIYPQRRKLIQTGRPKIADQIQYAQQMDRLMAKQALEAGIHFPHDETWGKITAPNAPEPEETQASSAPTGPIPPENASPAPAPVGMAAPAGAPTSSPSPIDVQPTAATSAPGWAAQTGSLF